jgi:hypothetical protein
MKENNNIENQIRDILIELTDILGWKQTENNSAAFRKAKFDIIEIIQKIYKEQHRDKNDIRNE